MVLTTHLLQCLAFNMSPVLAIHLIIVNIDQPHDPSMNKGGGDKYSCVW